MRLTGSADRPFTVQPPSEKFAIPYVQAHLTGQNQEPSFERHNSNGKLHYSWAVDLGQFKLVVRNLCNDG